MSLGFQIPTKVPFAKKQVVGLRDFSLGLNNKISPLLLDAKELQDIQNFNYDEKGSLKKRKGYVHRYAAIFDTSPARDMYNYRRQDGTSRMVLAASTKLYNDKPQFTKEYTTQADWEETGVQTSEVSTVYTVGDITLQPKGMLGWLLLGTFGALLGGDSAVTRTGTWIGGTIDISAVTDQTTGTMTVTQTVPASTTIVVETRASTDGSSWGAWTALGAGSTIVSAAQDYLQVRVTMTSTSYNTHPSVQSILIKYDTTSTVSTLATALSSLARYTMATQNDIVYITNGVNVMSKWDGTTYTATSPGSPPTAKYVMVHKNIMFLTGNATNASRLYYSTLGDPESWPALNFIDVGKGDGDQTTGLAILLDRLVITKNNSVWILEGDSSSTFVLRRISDEAGCVDQHTIVTVRNTLGMLARDGFYFFDGVRMALASEKILGTFDTLNKSQFGLASAVHYPSIRKVFVSVPGAGLTYNDTTLVFDTLRAAWTIYKGINAACWVVWRQFNTDHLLFGDATTGQVHEAETGYNDDSAAISAYAVTKALDFGGVEIAKFVSEALVSAKETSGTGDATINVSFFKDLGSETASKAATYTGPDVDVRRVTPSEVQAGQVRSLAVKVQESSTNRSVTIYGIAVEYQAQLGLRQTV
mgnify:CR=1 FL=1